MFFGPDDGYDSIWEGRSVLVEVRCLNGASPRSGRKIDTDSYSSSYYVSHLRYKTGVITIR
jgi:hypothetical protein